jgi:ribosomal protein S18 acetylase RimI-like enzyme
LSVEYRSLRPEEEGALLDLWMTVYPETDREKWRREWRALDPGPRRTFAAVAPDGTVLSSALYWPVPRRGADGAPSRVGQLSHVATHPGFRRRGHAARLTEMALAAMAADGCAWSLLFTSDEGRPLYERLGWRTQTTRHWTGPVAAGPADGAGYAVRPHDPTGPAGWGPIPGIQAAFNAGRPLATVRDESYWRGHYRARVTDWIAADGAFVLVATDAGGAARGYALAHAVPRGCFVAEVGALPGHERALGPLLGAVAARTGAAEAGMLLHAPGDVVPNGFGQQRSDAAMARPIAAAWSAGAIEEAFASADAVAWPFDET